MAFFVIQTPDPTLTYALIAQGSQRWAGNGTDGAAGTGNELREESEVSAANFANGLITLVQVFDKDDNFSNRYVGTIPSDLPASAVNYEVQGYRGNTIAEIADATGVFVYPGGGTIGPGADIDTILVNGDGLPLEGASTWITNDADGENIVAGTLVTDVNGHAVYLLNAGDTYYFWMYKSGWNSITGESFVAVAD